MRKVLAGLAALGLAVACANAASAASAPAVSGVYLAGGKPAAITDVSAHAGDPFDGKPVTALVFTTQAQNGDENADSDAHNGDFGDAIIVRVQPDGAVAGADMVHHGLDKTSGYISAIGVLSLKNYRAAGGQISGELTSGGPVDSGNGQKINIDLTFHTKAP